MSRACRLVVVAETYFHATFFDLNSPFSSKKRNIIKSHGGEQKESGHSSQELIDEPAIHGSAQ
jgi:hypothetical protein